MEDDPLERVSAYVSGFGVGARPMRAAIAALTEDAWTVDALIARSRLPRRHVEGLLDALGTDLERAPGGMRIAPGRVDAYRHRFALAQLKRTRLADPLDERLRQHPELLAQLHQHVQAAPPPVRALDHVTATPETAGRRALWLQANFDLTGARLLCVGDHDLTSLAVCAIDPELAVTVVDMEERILEFIDERAREHGWDVRCHYADLRHRLPPAVSGWADLVLTDPPYTPEGVSLFLSRGLQGMRDHEHGRLVMAYGFGEGHPALGLKVQRTIGRLHLAVEAILPGFNRYHGAQALGGASDLYVCRPTARTWQVLDRLMDTAVANVYSRGPQAVESAPPVLDAATAEAVRAYASGEDGPPVSLLAGRDWPASEAKRVHLPRLLTGGVPVGAPDPLVVAADLATDPGPWLLRLLLATNADRLAALVPASHPDLASAAMRTALARLVRVKYDLRFHRAAPTAHHAVVVARRVDPYGLDGSEPVQRRVLDRAHGTVGNIWREALIADSSGALTKKAARARIGEASSYPPALRARLVDLPRHQIAELLADVAASVRACS